jgi:hypothetical protein
LSPVQQGGEFDSLDSAGNSETEEQPVKMRLYGSARHIQLAGNFGVITALQKQFNNLLFARAEPNGLFPHQVPLFWLRLRPRLRNGELFQIS